LFTHENREFFIKSIIFSKNIITINDEYFIYKNKISFFNFKINDKDTSFFFNITMDNNKEFNIKFYHSNDKINYLVNEYKESKELLFKLKEFLLKEDIIY